MGIRFNVGAIINLAKLTKMIEEKDVLTVVSAMVDYKKGGYTLIVDTVWKNSEKLAYSYFWERQNLRICDDYGCIVEEKTLKL